MAALVGLLVFVPAIASAAPGDPDTSFGGDGIVVTNDLQGGLEGDRLDVAVQADRKIVVVGHSGDSIAVRRYTVDGQPDPTFDDDGTALITPGDGPAVEGRAVAVDHAGRIVVAGAQSVGSVIVARLTTAGEPDTTFSRDGEMIVAHTGLTLIADVAVDTHDRVLLAGEQYVTEEVVGGSFGRQMVLLRMAVHGPLDRSFGDDGRVVLNPTSRRDGFDAVAVDGDGRIDVVGTIGGGGPHARGIAVRLKASGRPDRTFGVGGVALVDLGPGTEGLHGVVATPNGGVVAAGQVRGAHGHRAVVVWLDAAGRFDRSFSDDGRAVLDLGRGGEAAEDLVMTSGNRVVVGGTMRFGSPDHAAFVVRYRPNGTLDPAFSGNGWTVVDTTPDRDHADAVGRDPSGAVVLAVSSVDQVAVARLTAG